MKARDVLCWLVLTGSGSAALACEHPPVPNIPDQRIRGRLEETVKQDTLAYVTGMARFVSCIQAEHAAAQESGASSLHLALLVRRNNQAVAELELISDIYSSRVEPIETLMAQIPTADPNAVSCITAGRGANVRPVDRQNLIFYTASGETYHAQLERDCPLLTRSSRVEYDGAGTIGSQVCNRTLITVEGNTCRIQQIVPITREAAEEMFRR